MDISERMSRDDVRVLKAVDTMPVCTRFISQKSRVSRGRVIRSLARLVKEDKVIKTMRWTRNGAQTVYSKREVKKK